MPLPRDDLFDLLARNMTMRQMRMLLAVAEQKSVIRAAQELHVAQPAISRALGALERTLGVALFDRLPQGMTATVFGDALLRRIRAIFGELRDAGEELRSLQDGAYGHVRIGCTRLLVAGALPRVLSVFLRQRGGIDVSIIEGSTDALMGELRARNVDIVIGRLPSSAGREPDLRYEALFEERLLLVCPPDHPLVRRRKVSLADLMNEPWVLPLRQSMLFRAIAETFSAHELPLPAARVQVESPRIMLKLVSTAGMIGLVPGSNLTDAGLLERVAVLSAAEAISYGSVGFMTLGAKDPTPATAALIAVLRTELPAIVHQMKPGKTNRCRRAPPKRAVQPARKSRSVSS